MYKGEFGFWFRVRKYGNLRIFTKQMVKSIAQKVNSIVQKINTELCSS